MFNDVDGLGNSVREKIKCKIKWCSIVQSVVSRENMCYVPGVDLKE